MCSAIGRFAIGSIGFGWEIVNGRSRVPSPPAMITAFTSSPYTGDRCGKRRRHNNVGGDVQPMGKRARTVAEQEERKRHQQAERAGLPDPQDVDSRRPGGC
jgi:hypothetical protein